MLELALNLGLLAAILGGGIAAERHVGLPAVRAGLPPTLRWGIDLLAFGVFGALLFVERVPIPLVDDTIAAMGVFGVLWIGLPPVATQFVEPRDRAGEVDRRACDR